MKVFSVRVNDYGYGDFTGLVFCAPNREEAIKYLQSKDFRFDPDDLYRRNSLSTNLKEPSIIVWF